MTKFGDILDKYVVLKLPLNRYKGTSRTLESDFQIVGSEVREGIRKDEERLLSLYFRHWQAPYHGNLKGWRNDTPVYILYQGTLVSGMYLCDQNEFDEGINWGQLHYFFTEPAFKKKGLHSILVKQAMDRAKSWNLQGVIINTDRHLLPEVYIRWGAIPWKEIKKVHPDKVPLALIKRLLRPAGKLIQVLRALL